jgi:membrane protease YdiL (CAAX protease family)
LSSETKALPTWNARQGYVCLFALILASLALNQGYRIWYESSAGFANWVNENYRLAQLAFFVIRAGVWLLIGIWVSQITSVAAFLRKAGLDQGPTLEGWVWAWVAIALGLIVLFIVEKGWGQPDELAPVYSQGSEGHWRFFMVYRILLLPFVAEVVMRGLAYRAFRGSYNPALSTLIVVGVYVVYFHWGLVSRDLTALLLLTALDVVLCILRERTPSTWNCVLFHAVYNATVMRQWFICFVGMAIVLLICRRWFDTARGRDLP